MKTMKAIRIHTYGKPDVLQYEDAPIPTPAAGEILVQVKAAGINHLDWGMAGGFFKAIFPIQFPWIPGLEISGIVAAVGEGVQAFKTGDEVYGITNTGAYAAYTIVQEALIAHKPASRSFAQAASVPIGALVAHQGLFEHAQLKAGDTILIHGGAGAIGAYAIQFAHQQGIRVITTASGVDEQFLRSLGAAVFIDYKTTKFETVITEKVDAVFDLVGSDTQVRSYPLIKTGGYLLAANQPPVQAEADAYGVKAIMVQMHPDAKFLSELAQAIDNGKYKVNLAKTYPLHEAAAAWKDVARNSSRPPAEEINKGVEVEKKSGKIVLSID